MAPKTKGLFGFFKKKKDPVISARSESMENVTPVNQKHQFSTPPLYKTANESRDIKSSEDVNGNNLSRKRFAAPPPPPHSKGAAPQPNGNPNGRAISVPNLVENGVEEDENEVKIRVKKEAPPPPLNSSNPVSPIPPKKPTRDYRHSQLIEEERKKEEERKREEEEKERKREEDQRREREEEERRRVEEKRREEERKEKQRKENDFANKELPPSPMSTPMNMRKTEKSRDGEKRGESRQTKEKMLTTEIIHYSPPGSIRSQTLSPEPQNDLPHVERKSNIVLTDTVRMKSMKVSCYDGSPLSTVTPTKQPVPSGKTHPKFSEYRMDSQEITNSMAQIGDTIRRSAEARKKLELHHEDMILREKYDALRKKFDLWQMMKATGEESEARRLQKDLITEHDEVMELLSLQYPTELSKPTGKMGPTIGYKKRPSITPDLFAPRSTITPSPLSISPIQSRNLQSSISSRPSLSPSCSISPSLSSSSEEEIQRNTRVGQTQTARALPSLDENSNVVPKSRPTVAPVQNTQKPVVGMKPAPSVVDHKMAANRVLEEMNELERRERELRNLRQQDPRVPSQSSNSPKPTRETRPTAEPPRPPTKRKEENGRKLSSQTGSASPVVKQKSSGNNVVKSVSTSQVGAPKIATVSIGVTPKSPSLPHRSDLSLKAVTPVHVRAPSTESQRSNIATIEVKTTPTSKTKAPPTSQAPPPMTSSQWGPAYASESRRLMTSASANSIPNRTMSQAPPPMTTFRIPMKNACIQADESEDPLKRQSPSTSKSDPRPKDSVPVKEAARLPVRPQQNRVPTTSTPHKTTVTQSRSDKRENIRESSEKNSAASSSQKPQNSPITPNNFANLKLNKISAPEERNGFNLGRVLDTPPSATGGPAKVTPPPPPPPLPKATPTSGAPPPPPPPPPIGGLKLATTPVQNNRVETQAGNKNSPSTPNAPFSISELNDQKKKLKTVTATERPTTLKSPVGGDVRNDLLAEIRESGGMGRLKKVQSPIKK